MLTMARVREQGDERSFLLRAQPAMTGLIDGSLSTLAPIFATVSAALGASADPGQATQTKAARC
jgi:hypothetical protein